MESLDAGSARGSSEIVALASRHTRRALRITGALGGGLAIAARGSPLIALSTRIELGRRTLVGLGASLWIASGPDAVDVQGQVLATFARRGLARWLELGGGAGLHFGNGTGPAAAVSLRFHLPPNPRAAAYLRYDGALLSRDAERSGQHAITLGLEVGFSRAAAPARLCRRGYHATE